jgi:methionine sulfoxide reductase catalytic subunit
MAGLRRCACDYPEIIGSVSSDEKNIGRRAFLGLILAGIVALFFGKDILPRVTTGGSSSGGFGHPVSNFRINSVAVAPPFDETTWRLAVDGLVRDPLNLSYAEFLALPQVTPTRDFYCVEGWGVQGVVWKGVQVAELMRRAGIDPKADKLIFHSGDGVYADSLTIEQASLDDTLLAFELNGAPLTEDMGRPVRLIYPGHFGYKYVKWVVRMEASDQSFTGYWEHYGYSSDATIPPSPLA